MFLYSELCARADTAQPVRVGLIGAGKFGSMFLSQVPTTPGRTVSAIADLDPSGARQACATVGWPEDLIAKTQFCDDALEMMQNGGLDVIVEATGNPVVGVTHAKSAIQNGLHIVMVNVEADVLAGAQLAREAKAAGVVYSMAYGDQPALTCELVDWARSTGFDVVAAGKGTKYLPS
jgi:predicted homoserine dehydrogenase-like protein